MYEMSCINHPAVKLDRICFEHKNTHIHKLCVYKATVLACINRCKSFFIVSKTLQIYLYLFTVNHCWKICCSSLKAVFKMGEVSTETLANSPASDWRIIWLIICFIAMLTKISYGFRWMNKTCNLPFEMITVKDGGGESWVRRGTLGLGRAKHKSLIALELEMK